MRNFFLEGHSADGYPTPSILAPIALDLGLSRLLILDPPLTPMTSFWKYKVYVDTHRGSSWRGPQMRVGWLTTAIFGNLSGYFFGNFKDKASNITWRYATFVGVRVMAK